jgi:methionyl-tRNA formyltransferase
MIDKRFVFFGTSEFSVIILNELHDKFQIQPSLVVTAPDKRVGRKQILTAPEAKVWAEKNKINVFQPVRLKADDVVTALRDYELFLVASYGKIIPKEILGLPRFGSINIHPSMLPKYRGPSPIQSQILNGEKNIGATIMLMDEEMDHGPILAQKEIPFSDPYIGEYEEVERKLAEESSSLFVQTIQKFLNEEVSARPQNHPKATYTKFIKKEDGEIFLSNDPTESEKNYRKYLAFHRWPKVFFFHEGKRNIITEATFEKGVFKILRIIPEGKKEQEYREKL